MNYESSTTELRQVWHEAWRQTARGDICHFGYYTTQQKWLTQDGEPYYSPEPRNEWAVKTGDWHPLAPNIGYRWTPCKPEWRDILIVQAEDIK